MPQAELQETLQAYPMFSYVVDFNGDVVAALTSWPLKVPDLALERHACALCLDTCLSMLDHLLRAVQFRLSTCELHSQCLRESIRGHHMEHSVAHRLARVSGSHTPQVPDRDPSEAKDMKFRAS